MTNGEVFEHGGVPDLRHKLAQVHEAAHPRDKIIDNSDKTASVTGSDGKPHLTKITIIKEQVQVQDTVEPVPISTLKKQLHYNDAKGRGYISVFNRGPYYKSNQVKSVTNTAKGGVQSSWYNTENGAILENCDVPGERTGCKDNRNLEYNSLYTDRETKVENPTEPLSKDKLLEEVSLAVHECQVGNVDTIRCKYNATGKTLVQDKAVSSPTLRPNSTTQRTTSILDNSNSNHHLPNPVASAGLKTGTLMHNSLDDFVTDTHKVEAKRDNCDANKDRNQCLREEAPLVVGGNAFKGLEQNGIKFLDDNVVPNEEFYQGDGDDLVNDVVGKIRKADLKEDPNKNESLHHDIHPRLNEKIHQDLEHNIIRHENENSGSHHSTTINNNQSVNAVYRYKYFSDGGTVELLENTGERPTVASPLTAKTVNTSIGSDSEHSDANGADDIADDFTESLHNAKVYSKHTKTKMDHNLERTEERHGEKSMEKMPLSTEDVMKHVFGTHKQHQFHEPNLFPQINSMTSNGRTNDNDRMYTAIEETDNLHHQPFHDINEKINKKPSRPIGSGIALTQDSLSFSQHSLHGSANDRMYAGIEENSNLHRENYDEINNKINSNSNSLHPALSGEIKPVHPDNQDTVNFEDEIATKIGLEDNSAVSTGDQIQGDFFEGEPIKARPPVESDQYAQKNKERNMDPVHFKDKGDWYEDARKCDDGLTITGLKRNIHGYKCKNDVHLKTKDYRWEKPGRDHDQSGEMFGPYDEHYRKKVEINTYAPLSGMKAWRGNNDEPHDKDKDRGAYIQQKHREDYESNLDMAFSPEPVRGVSTHDRKSSDEDVQKEDKKDTQIKSRTHWHDSQINHVKEQRLTNENHRKPSKDFLHVLGLEPGYAGVLQGMGSGPTMETIVMPSSKLLTVSTLDPPASPQILHRVNKNEGRMAKNKKINGALAKDNFGLDRNMKKLNQMQQIHQMRHMNMMKEPFDHNMIPMQEFKRRRRRHKGKHRIHGRKISGSRVPSFHYEEEAPEDIYNKLNIFFPTSEDIPKEQVSSGIGYQRIHPKDGVLRKVMRNPLKDVQDVLKWEDKSMERSSGRPGGEPKGRQKLESHQKQVPIMVEGNVASPVTVDNRVVSPIEDDHSVLNPIKVDDRKVNPIKDNGSVSKSIKVDHSVSSSIKIDNSASSQPIEQNSNTKNKTTPTPHVDDFMNNLHERLVNMKRKLMRTMKGKDDETSRVFKKNLRTELIHMKETVMNKLNKILNLGKREDMNKPQSGMKQKAINRFLSISSPGRSRRPVRREFAIPLLQFDSFYRAINVGNMNETIGIMRKRRSDLLDDKRK